LFVSVEPPLAETITVLLARSYAVLTALGDATSVVLVLVTVVTILPVVSRVEYARFALAVACQTPEAETNLISAFPSPALRERSVALPSVIVAARRTSKSESFKMLP
jgi:hypothetical protein